MRHHEVRLVGPVAKRAPSPVDEASRHAKRLGTDAIEGVVGDEQDRVWCQADDRGGGAIGRHMRLEGARTGNLDHALKRKTEVRLCCLKHVRITIREHDESVALGQPFECRHHVRKGF